MRIGSAATFFKEWSKKRVPHGRLFNPKPFFLAASLLLLPGSVWAGSASYVYDTLGRLVQVTYSNGAIITYSYDAAGNRTTHVVTGAP